MTQTDRTALLNEIRKLPLEKQRAIIAMLRAAAEEWERDSSAHAAMKALAAELEGPGETPKLTATERLAKIQKIVYWTDPSLRMQESPEWAQQMVTEIRKLTGDSDG
jgi:hypothetical protein